MTPYETELTERDGVELHRDCVTDDGDAITWSAATDLFDAFTSNASNVHPLVTDEELQPVTTPHSTAHDELLLEQLRDLRMSLRTRHHVLWTYQITLCGVPHENGSWLPPVDFTDELLSSWPEIRDELYSVVGDNEWEYVTFLEPGGVYGYPRLNLAVMVNGRLDADDLWSSVVDAHCEHSEVARADHHVRHRSFAHQRSMKLDEVVENRLAGFLGRRGDEHSRAFSALLWAGQYDRFRYSQGARSHFDPVALPFEQPTAETE